MKWYIILLNIFELLACVTGLFYWRKIRNSFWQWFPVYLGVIFLTEMTGEYLLFVKRDLSANIFLYTYFGIPAQFFFFYWLFYQYFKIKKSNRKWSLISTAIYLVALIADLTYISKHEFYFESFSYVIGCLFMLILLLIFLFGFTNEEEIVNYKKSMMFWVCIGLLIFYIGATPFFAFRSKLYKENTAFFYVYWYVQFGLNYLMYLLFTVAFIWGKPR